MPDYYGGDFQALPEQALKELEFMIWDYGVENIVIGMFQQLLHNCTRNSCKILEGYHLCCSGAHHGNGVRVNTNTRFNGHSPFTTELTC